MAGKDAVFDVTLKEVKEKRLPEVDDDFAAEAGGFDTLEELRADIADKVRDAREREIEAEFREAVVDAAADAAKIDVSHDLVHAKSHEMWANTRRRLERQGIPPDRYLQIAGTLAFSPGTTSRTISVPVFGDLAPEPHEYFLMILSHPVNATIAQAWGVGVILTDDP